MKEQGYDDEYCNICLTHSYLNNDINCTAGGIPDDIPFRTEFIKNHEYTIEEKIIANRNYYASLNSEIEKIEFEVDIIQSNIKGLEKENDNIDVDILKEFYDEVNEQIGNLSVSFDKLIRFNEKLKNNKLQTNKIILSEKLKDLEKFKTTKTEFYNQNKASMFLIESGTVQII